MWNTAKILPEMEVVMRCTQLEVVVLIWLRLKTCLESWGGVEGNRPQLHIWKQLGLFQLGGGCNETELIIKRCRSPWNWAGSFFQREMCLIWGLAFTYLGHRLMSVIKNITKNVHTPGAGVPRNPRENAMSCKSSTCILFMYIQFIYVHTSEKK